MEKTCKYCQIDFVVTRDKRLNSFYCCRKCYNLDHHVKTHCKTCGSEFVHHKTKKRIFCSIKCAHKFRYPQTFKKCLFCDKNFEITAVNAENIYCSKKCYNNSGKRSQCKIREKNPNFLKGAYAYRTLALRELPNFCVACKATNNLDVHHIDKNRQNNELKNLMILCHPCHMRLHRGKIII